MSEFLQFVLTKAEEPCITSDEVMQWAGSLDNWDFYNAAAIEIATMYDRGEITYSFCDDVMNDLWGVVLQGLGDGPVQLPQPFYEIYEAFDAGEYHRAKDGSDDPITEFTTPLIAKLVSRFEL